MPRFLFSRSLILLLLSFTLASAAPKNIVLFVADDLSPDAGCYGNQAIKTPHIDRLAAEGVRFDHAFCTTASCSASRSVILTGWHNHANRQYGHQHSYHHFRTQDAVRSLPVLLSEAGYRTARSGKYHVGPEEVYRFDHALKGNARNGVEMADHCRDFLNAEDKRPFFLYFCTSDPHRGGGKAPGDNQHNPNSFGNRKNGYPGVETIEYDPKDVEVHPFLPDTPVCREELAQYYRSVSRVDQGLGRLVEVLKEAGVYDDTLILVTSDHGIAFPGGKTTLYDGGMKIPMVVRNPRQKHRGVCNALVSLVDLTPTLLDYAGATPQGYAFHGRSFLQAMNEENPQDWDEVYASHTFHEITMYYPMRVVRNRDYKLIWNLAHGLPYPFASDLWAAPTWQDVYAKGTGALYGKRTVGNYIHRPKFELYDLKKDPHEVYNLAEQSEHAELLKTMQEKLRSFQKRTKDPWIMKWKYE